MKYLIIIFLLITSLFSPSLAFAHSGGTDAYGCHNCYTSECYGEYHCHNGGYTAPSVYVPPRCVSIIGASGKWTFVENASCTQDVKFSWDKGVDDVYYSLGISKTAGADPGPKSDTTSREFVFKDVKPGTWYINLKTWSLSCNASRVSYWKVVVPEPMSSFSATIGTYDNDLHISGKCLKSIVSNPTIGKITDLTSSTIPLTLKKVTTVKLTGYPIYGKSISQEVKFDPNRIVPTPTPKPIPSQIPIANNSPSIDSEGLTFVFILFGGVAALYFLFRGGVWFIQYARAHDWVYTTIIWIVLVGGIWAWNYFSEQSTTETPTTTSTYKCNCSKTCANLSCAEAQYQLKTCKCTVRDADHDGIACDAQCQ